jgi:hypothetical protein
MPSQISSPTGSLEMYSVEAEPQVWHGAELLEPPAVSRTAAALSPLLQVRLRPRKGWRPVASTRNRKVEDDDERERRSAQHLQ